MHNGKEFTGHVEVAAALERQYYFARPYPSWERGLSDHTNRSARQYWPNNRPGKLLVYRTPAAVLQAG